VALNCVANEIIASRNIFESIYEFPDSADSGLAVGLAFSAVRKELSISE
jgi:predicted NodU family carbamoyl transferase